MPLVKFLRNFTLFLLLLFLPTQLGLHFWPVWALVEGLRIDYLSPTLYLSFFFLITLLLVFLKTVKPRPSYNYSAVIVIFLLLSFFIQSFSTSLIPVVALEKFDLLLFLFTLVQIIAKFNRSFSWGWLGLAAAVLWTSVLTILQFLFQGSLGLWVLGERSFSVLTPGIAKAFIYLPNQLQAQFLRPYASFSHPNSLAGFLLISLFLLFALQRFVPALLLHLCRSLAVVAIVLTFSRSAYICLLLFGGLSFLSHLINFKTIFSMSLLFTAVFCLAPFFAFNHNLFPVNFLSQSSVAIRLEENKAALSFFASHPSFGLGLGNFIPSLGKLIPSSQFPALSSPTLWLQPVHNIFLLIATETGVTGFIFTIVILFLTMRKLYLHRNTCLLFAFLSILLTGSFDHYWLTLIQNQLLFALTFGLIWRRSSSLLLQ